MIAIFVSAFVILFNLLIILFGFYVVRNPDSDWVRFIRRIPDDVVQEDVDISIMKFRGILMIICGVFMTLMSIMSTIVYMG